MTRRRVHPAVAAAERELDRLLAIDSRDAEAETLAVTVDRCAIRAHIAAFGSANEVTLIARP